MNRYKKRKSRCPVCNDHLYTLFDKTMEYPQAIMYYCPSCKYHRHIGG